MGRNVGKLFSHYREVFEKPDVKAYWDTFLQVLHELINLWMMSHAL